MFDFSGKTLWITGANGGISRCVARTFFEMGASCILTDLDAEGVSSFARELDPTGERCVAIGQDAGSSADADRVAGFIKERFGSLDFLVTGAGIYRDQLIEGMTDEQWRQTCAVNLDGVFFTCRAATPLLNDGGAVVNVASMSGHKGSYMHGHYAATKGAVLAFTRTLALELAPRVRVNAVSPGLIDTPMVQPLMDVQGEQLLDLTPLKRLGAPEEVGNVVAFLCSPWASFITAETVHINGGLYVSG